MSKIFKAAAIQASPVCFDLRATLDKAISLVREAATHGATLIVFPEVYLPGYPFFIWLDSYGKSLKQIGDYIQSCPMADGPEYLALESLAKELDVIIVMGAADKEGGTLYMAQWIIGPNGLISNRRKLKPSIVERLIFGEGDGSDLKVHETPIGRLGALNCWEHTQPLIKHVMAYQNEEVHAASWPHLTDEMPHFSLSLTANFASNRCYAVETGSFVVMSTAPMSVFNSDYLCGNDETKKSMLGLGGGSSAIFDPEGREISANRIDPDKEGIVYAQIDTTRCGLAKAALDCTGHYGRGDVFQVVFNDKPRELLTKRDEVEHVGPPSRRKRFL